MKEWRLDEIYDFEHGYGRARHMAPGQRELHPELIVRHFPPAYDAAVHPDGLALQEALKDIKEHAEGTVNISAAALVQNFVELAKYFTDPADAAKVAKAVEEAQERGYRYAGFRREAAMREAAKQTGKRLFSPERAKAFVEQIRATAPVAHLFRKKKDIRPAA